MKLSKFSLSLIAALVLPGVFQTFAQSTNLPNPRDFSAFQIINDRNIFDPNRRPRSQPNRNPAPRPPQIVDTFSLVGTMSYSNVLLAFFEGTSSDYRKSLSVGNRIAGYTLKEIRHDAVKLTLGTNEIELKVGMQMRRSEDGSWTSGDAPAGNFNSYASSGNRQRGNDRGERRFERNNVSNAGNNSQIQTPAAPAPDAPAVTPPADMGNMDPNDPVTRLMLRRMQEENGGQPVRPETPPDEAPSQNQPNQPGGSDNQEAAPNDSQTNSDNSQNVPPNRNENRN